MSTTTRTDRIADQLTALFDLDTPAKQFRTPNYLGDITVREPDFIDLANATAVWIGTDAAVEIPTRLMGEMEDLVRRSGWLARSRRYPSEFAILVQPHDPSYTHPAGGSPAYAAWRTLTDTLEGTN